MSPCVKRRMASRAAPKGGSMRLVITVGLALMAFSNSSGAADIPASSRIEAVTVFPSGAEIRRGGQLKPHEGAHTGLFTDPPPPALAGSDRLQTKATGKLENGPVHNRRPLAPP